MNRVLSLFVVGIFAISVAGCGGTREIPAAKETPKVDHDAVKANMQKSFEMSRPQGQDPSKQ